jgi:hypothetical protein
MKYNRTLIGRALVLSRLKEAAKLWAFKDVECSYVDATGASDKRMGDVVHLWKNHLHNAESKLWKKLRKRE